MSTMSLSWVTALPAATRQCEEADVRTPYRTQWIMLLRLGMGWGLRSMCQLLVGVSLSLGRGL